MAFPELALRLAEVREAVGVHQRRGGWEHPVRIIAVTKTHGPDAVRAATLAGIEAIGENRIQEALAKQDALPDVAVEWHFIGRLQRNKVRRAIDRFTWIHSVDRPALAQELERRIPLDSPRQRILVEVNCSGEPQKGGVEPDELMALLETVAECGRLELRGLMTMAEYTTDQQVQRRTFQLLRTLRDQAALAGHPVPELSMGMSGDYTVAVEEGATMIRLGTLLFGGRSA
ncbi:MAG: YggS family pyridoxal phosphate-dependent enzyme [Gemmatimonadales bacterium]|nr:YggS family pyridoxal phosphate-dependent enzyme [Gemmatimonadales bacterium]